MDLNAIAKEVQAFLVQKGLTDFPRRSAVLIGILAASVAEESEGDRGPMLDLCAGISAELLEAAEKAGELKRRNASRMN
jgi:hypothetical protein